MYSSDIHGRYLGSSAIFLSDSLLRLETGSKLEEEKEYGIKGFTVNAQYVKSRSNASGRKMVLIFDQAKGFNNLLTNVHFLRENKYLLGSGHGYWIETMPEKKFKFKNVQEIYDTDEEFRKGFDDYVHSIYDEFLTASNDDEEEESADLELVDCIDEEKSIYKGNDGNSYYYDTTTGTCSLVEN